MISVKNLTKIYKLKGKNGVNNVTALNDVSVDFPDTGLVFLLGKSGSGKSTLLNTIGGLDSFDSGEIIIKGKSSKDFKQSDFDSYRNTFIGFIFQEYNVLEEFTVGKNLSLALELQGKTATKEEVNKLLEQVDLEGYYKRKPNQLSGGQKQRVAIARALIKNPEIIMADEPTGALDSATGKQVMDTLKKLSKEKLVIIVSHDREFAEIYGDRVIELKDGKIIKDDTKTEVEPTKSESGVSFIDDKIIHIKKGQQINQDDLKKINEMIMSNINNEDTIISFDQKSNTDVKKSAFITDEGNREVFKTTTKEDIKRINHNPKDFKMIKSKLKLKDSFKMGASSLKHKPIRLIFTILLSVFAFGMFGVVNTMSSFDRATSVHATVEQLNISTLAVNKRVSQYDTYGYPINDELFDKFQADNKNHTLNKVIASGSQFSLSGENSESYDYKNDYTIYRKKVSGLMAIDESIQNQFKLNLIHGSLPQNDNELCISNNLLDTIIKYYTNISSWDDLNGKTFRLDNINASFKIVGVLQDNTNLDKYKDLTGDSSSMNDNRYKYDELDVVMNYSLVNMCYTNEATFNNYFNNYQRNNGYIQYNIYRDGEDYCNGGGSRFTKASNAENHYSYMWQHPTITIDTLQDNQVILSKSLLTNNLEISEEDLLTKLQNGLTVNFCYGYEGKDAPAFSLEVVGCVDSYDQIIVTDAFYNNWFKGSDYILTNVNGNNTDKELIKYFEEYKDTVMYNIQCQATPVLDDFGSMIESMAKILLWVGVALAVFAGLMLMNFISTSISYKKREIGVLRAIGARSKDVFSIFFSESFIICMINFLLSAIGSSIICNVINNSFVSKMGVSLVLMVFGFKQIMLLLGVALLVAFVSSFFPVYRFAKKNPIDSINNR